MRRGPHGWAADGRKDHQSVVPVWDKEEQAEALSCSHSLGEPSLWQKTHLSHGCANQLLKHKPQFNPL